jgi:hypothetical protein
MLTGTIARIVLPSADRSAGLSMQTGSVDCDVWPVAVCANTGALGPIPTSAAAQARLPNVLALELRCAGITVRWNYGDTCTNYQTRKPGSRTNQY